MGRHGKIRATMLEKPAIDEDLILARLRDAYDLAVFAEAVLLGDEGGADRAQAVRYVRMNFLPGGTIARAYAALAARAGDNQAVA